MSAPASLPAVVQDAERQAVHTAPALPRYPIAVDERRMLAWATGLFAAGAALAIGAVAWAVISLSRRERRLWRWYDRRS